MLLPFSASSRSNQVILAFTTLQKLSPYGPPNNKALILQGHKCKILAPS